MPEWRLQELEESSGNASGEPMAFTENDLFDIGDRRACRLGDRLHAARAVPDSVNRSGLNTESMIPRHLSCIKHRAQILKPELR